ncbi:MAG: non-homologous end-joining DNA ligase [Simkaniaceae bacterium]|nr:non-homologous end-joining DNA ligase [Candidatus Sacchlamyda saccharinae]
MKVEITHPDKVLFPKEKITKKELADYYAAAARLMVPHLKNRPISMKRYPKGIKQPGFFQKNAPQGLPSWIKTAQNNMILCNDKNTLLWLANQNCITPHIWLSRVDKPDYPDRLIFDLDPPQRKPFASVVEAALLLRKILEKKYKLKTFVMTTGSKGLHVVVPIKRTRTFDEVRSFAKEVAEELASEDPKKFTTAMRKEKRRGRIYIDVMRNAHGATAVAPYSVRPKEDAPIATPITWAELKNPELRSDTYSIQNIKPRLRRNPWARIEASAKTLPI